MFRLPHADPPAAADISMEEMALPTGDADITLYLRNKRPTALEAYDPHRTVLFVHGSTYPASATFDLALDGYSWMDHIAARGYDVYLLDLRGYGQSGRPRAMDEDRYANAPIVTGDVAIGDIARAVEFICRRRNIPRLALIGWSWGATLIGGYAIRHPHRVTRLVQYGPPWATETPLTRPDRVAAYRTLSREQIRAGWYHAIPPARQSELMPAAWFEALVAAIFASDPLGAARTPPVVRAPNGVLQDIYDYHGAGVPYYDAAGITVPVLLVVGEWDRDTPPYMARAQLPLLVNAPDKRLIELAGATHHVMLETNRMELFIAVQGFLDEG